MQIIGQIEKHNVESKYYKTVTSETFKNNVLNFKNIHTKQYHIFSMAMYTYSKNVKT